MQNTIPRLPVTKALLAMLREATGKPVGDQAIPADPASPDGFAKPTYFILYPLWSERSGSLGQPTQDADIFYQLRCVASRGDQLDWAYDKAIETLVDRDDAGKFVVPLLIDGLGVMDRRLADEDSGSVGRDTSSATLSLDIRFAVKVTRER